MTKLRMKEDIRKRWTAKLRDENTKQGEGALCKVSEEGNAYCCLGVLTEIAVEDGIIAPGIEGTNSWGNPVLKYENGTYTDYIGVERTAAPEADVLPQAVREWAGLDESNPEVTAEITEYDEETGDEVVKLHTASIADFNDGNVGMKPFTFAQLADIIDQQL